VLQPFVVVFAPGQGGGWNQAGANPSYTGVIDRAANSTQSPKRFDRSGFHGS
jgi:hypothetical protein